MVNMGGAEADGRDEPDVAVTFLEAAERVLSGAGEPMHYARLTRVALERGLLVSSGKTPEATMSAQISQHLAAARRRGNTPRFSGHGRGVYGLTAWEPTGVWREIDQHNDRAKDRMLESLMALSPEEFEHRVSELLSAQGFEVTVTRRSGDGGIDIRGRVVVGALFFAGVAVQVKRWRDAVTDGTVRQTRGALDPGELGVIVTTSRFTGPAVVEARRAGAVPIGLITGRELVELFAASEFGVSRNTVDILEFAGNDVCGGAFRGDDTPAGG